MNAQKMESLLTDIHEGKELSVCPEKQAVPQTWSQECLQVYMDI